MSDPALVFGAKLPWSGDAGHAKDHSRKPEDAGIVMHVLISGPFGAAIRRVEVEGLAFRYSMMAGVGVAQLSDFRFLQTEVSIHLIGRGEEDKWLVAAF